MGSYAETRGTDPRDDDKQRAVHDIKQNNDDAGVAT